jgi:hypothetical protein
MRRRRRIGGLPAAGTAKSLLPSPPEPTARMILFADPMIVGYPRRTLMRELGRRGAKARNGLRVVK